MKLTESSSWSERYDFIADLLSRWELASVPEALLLPDLPRSVAAFYTRFGSLHSFWSAQDHLLTTDKLKHLPDRIVFAYENQSVVEWSFPRDAGDDPPVEARSSSPPWRKVIEATTFSEFMVAFAEGNLRWVCRRRTVDGPMSLRGIAIVERHLDHLPISDWHWPQYPTRFYVGPDAAAIIDAARTAPWLWLVCRTDDAIARFERLLEDAEVDWTER